MKRRILICDDESHIQRAVEFKLLRAGFDVECASDGEAAWQAIQRQQPDALVTDCQMPRLDGFALVRRLRAEEATRDLPVVMLTAKGIELPRRELIEEWGVSAILGKPFSPQELAKTVERILAERSAAAATVEISASAVEETRS